MQTHAAKVLANFGQEAQIGSIWSTVCLSLVGQKSTMLKNELLTTKKLGKQEILLTNVENYKFYRNMIY